MPLLPELNEDFSAKDGALAPYRSIADQSETPVRRHYDLRSYHSTDRRVPRTQADMRRWNAWYWDGWTQRDLAEGLVLEGREFRERTVGDIDDLWAVTTLAGAINNVTTAVTIASTTGFPVTNGFYAEIGPDTVGVDGEIVLVTNGAGTTSWTVLRGQLGTTAVAHSSGAAVEYTPLEGLSMFDLDYLVLGLGNEEWPDEAGVTVGKNAAWRYQAYMQVDLISGQERLVQSSYPDDILTGFELGTYYIEVPLRDFPAQSVPAHLNLANSFVEFTSSDTWAPAETDALPFNASINSVTNGGNTFLRFDRASLVNVDLSDIKKIRFRLNVDDPGQPPTVVPTVGAAGALSGIFDYKVTYTSTAGESLASPASATVTLATQRTNVGSIPLGPTGTTGRKLYRRTVGIGVTYPGVTGQTLLNGGHTIPVGTLTVDDTTTFTATGQIVLRHTAVKDVVLAYTGKTPTTFTGVTVVTGTSGAYPDNADIYQGTYPGGSLYPGGTSGYRLVATIADNVTTSTTDNYIVTGSEAEPPLASSFANMSFKTQNMRMIPVDYNFAFSDIDTKRAQLVRSIPRHGGLVPYVEDFEWQPQSFSPFGVGETIVQSGAGRFGTHGLRVITNGSSDQEGVQLSGLKDTTPPSLSPNTTYTMSVRMKAPLASRFHLWVNEYTGPTYVTTENKEITGTGNWEQYFITFTTNATIDGVDLFILTRTGTPAQALTFDVDSWRVDLGSVIGGEEAIYINTDQPKNLQQFILFNSGHVPANPQANEFSFFARYIDTNNHLRFRLRSDTTSTRIAIINRVQGVDNLINETTGAALVDETDYHLVTDLLNTAAIAILYETKGVFLGDLVMTTGAQTIYDFYNEVDNPSFEVGTTNWATWSPSGIMPILSQVGDVKEQGAFSMLITAQNAEGSPVAKYVWETTGSSVSPGERFYMRYHLYGDSGWEIGAREQTGGVLSPSNTPSAWQHVGTSIHPLTGGSIVEYIFTVPTGATTIQFTLSNVVPAATTRFARVDGFMMIEVGADGIVPPAYFDGSFASCTWFGAAHNSRSGKITTQKRGYIGYEFLPYNFDFTIQYIRSGGADFATFESEDFQSKQTVAGASLYPRNSAPVDMLQGVSLEATGDAVASSNVSQGQAPPSIQIDRTGAFWYGGIRSQEIAIIGDSEQTYIRGDIYPANTAKGLWRVLLFDPDGLVAWVGYIENLVANKWNSFEIPVRTQLAPAGYRVYLENNGFAPNDFTARYYLDNWKVDHDSVIWEASADNGSNWQHFFEALNSKYKGIKFGARGRNLKVKATALTSDAWIHSYELVPRYQVPGHRKLNQVEIDLETVSSAVSAPGGSTTLTWAHTVRNLTNRLLIVGVNASTLDAAPTSVTFGGVGLTKLTDVLGGVTRRVSYWYLINPAVSTANIVVTNAGGASHKEAAGAVNLYNTHQTTPFRDSDNYSISGTETGVTLNGAKVGDMIIDTTWFGVNVTQWDVEDSQTVVWTRAILNTDLTVNASAAGSFKRAGDGDVTTFWTHGSGSVTTIAGLVRPPVLPT